MAFPPCPVWLLQLTILQGVAGSKTACGQPEHSAETGGVQPISQGSWPWQTSIRTNGTHICGGSIINQQWVLSAAHCFPEYITASQYEVVLGAYHLSDNFSCITTLSVQRIIRHPNYNGRSDYSRDVAVVKLTSPVNFTNYIMPICLPDYSVPFSTDMECWVTGWQGTQSEEPSEVPQTPPELEVPPTDQSRFHKPFNVYRVEIWSKKSIKRDTICAGCQESERGLCQGDAGGPLACKLKKGWTQVGILSWGTGCTESSHPDVYVSVPFYTKWIQETVYNKKESERSGGLWNSSNKLTLFLTLLLLALL